MLFFCTVLLSCAFIAPKIQNQTAYADTTDSPFTEAELNGLAVAGGFTDYGDMCLKISKGETVNAKNFGVSNTISFGRYDWFPVLANSNGKNLILTLWLQTSINNYSFSDGTYGVNVTYASGDYYYSWIRAAINMGITDLGYYYGKWPNSETSTASPTLYYNDGTKSSTASCKPTEFTFFSEFVQDEVYVGQYAKYILAGSEYSDNVWLPSVGEAQVGNGSWGLTADYFGSYNGSTTFCWSRSDAGSYRNAMVLTKVGVASSYKSSYAYGIRPAIQVKLPLISNGPEDIEYTYKDSAYTIADVTGDWYYEDIMQVDLPSDMTNAGTKQVKVTLTDGSWIFSGVPTAGEDEITRYFKLTIKKADPKITFDTNSSYYTTLGFPEPEINIAGSLDWGVQVPEEGTNEYSYTFTPDDTDNYNIIRDKVTLKYYEPEIDHIDVDFNSGGADVYDKTSEQTYIKMFTVTVYYDDGGEPQVTTNFSVLGWTAGTNVTVTIKLPSGDTQKCTVPEIKQSVVNDIDVYFTQGSTVIYPYTPLGDLKDLLEVDAYWSHSSKAIGVDPEDYELSGDLLVGGSEITVTLKGTELSKTFTNITVTKGNYELGDIETTISKGNGEAYDPNDWVGELPDGLTVEFFYENSNKFDNVTEPGTYKVIAKFSGDSENYVLPNDITFTLTIDTNYAIPQVDSERGYDPDGNDFTPDGFDAIAELVELYENGRLVTAEEAFMRTELGTYEITVKFKTGAQAAFAGGLEEVTLNFAIVKRVVEMPEFLGGLAYSGKTITPTAENFKYDSVGCYFVSAESGLNAGSYFATFALTDSEHYEWAGANTRSAVRLTLADEELNEGEIQVPWTIAKATVSATAEEGKLPAFTCATVSDLSKYISYTYYKDEACTEKVAYSDMQPDTRYYVKATFTDEDENFELDDSALGVIGATISYDTPAAEPNFFQKAMAYIKENWLWFAIGAGVLLFLILLIIIIAVARRKNKEKREERKAEKKEEERQRRAEEREERMMRMQSMGGMPVTAAGMLAQQAMPTAQAQPAQSAGNDVNAQLLAEMRAQMAELRAENKAAQAVQQPIQPIQQPLQPQMPVQSMPAIPYGQTDNSALLMAKLEAEFARQAQQRSEKELADAKLQSEFDKLRAELHANGRLPASEETHGTDGQNGDIEMIGMLAATIWRNIKTNGTAATAEKLSGQMQSAQPTEAEQAGNYPNNAIITTTTTVDTTQKPLRESNRDKRGAKVERSEFTDVDGFYDNADY